MPALGAVLVAHRHQVPLLWHTMSSNEKGTSFRVLQPLPKANDTPLLCAPASLFGLTFPATLPRKNAESVARRVSRLCNPDVVVWCSLNDD